MPQPRYLYFLVFLLSLGIRLVFAMLHPADLTSDNDGYLAHAHPLAEGLGFIGPYSHRPTAFRPPGYPVILGLLLRCGLSDSAAVTVVNLSASMLIVWLTIRLAVQAGITIPWVMATCLAVALDPLLVRYSVLPMTEVLCAAVLLAAIVRYQSAPKDDHSGVAAALIAGVLFGVGAIIRPVVLVSCVFLTANTLFRTWRTRTEAQRPARNVLLRMLLPAMAAAIVLIPWIVRNAIQFHQLIPATTHGGYTLALGNNEDFYREVINGADAFPWDGPGLDRWQQRMIYESQQQGILQTSEPALDQWYYQQSLSAIRAEPISFLKATALRLRRFWAVSSAEAGVSGSVSIVVSVWYVLLWVGLLLERIAAWRQPLPASAIRTDLWMVVLSFVLMHAVYWTDARMRTPVMPILIVLAVSGWSSFMSARSSK